MTADEQREILEEIARDESNYPRDRIAAVRALREIDENAGPPPENELDKLIRTK